jgi:hypothetical protein
MTKARSGFFFAQAEMCRQFAISALSPDLNEQYLLLAKNWMTLGTQAAEMEEERLRSAVAEGSE